jgi:FAD/FMN-containing dehydrogenase
LPRLRPRRLAGWLVLLALAALLGPPAAHLACVAARDRGEEPPLAPGMRDDASHLEAARVARVIEVPADDEAALAAIRGALAAARAEGLQVSIAGARHSMGGQTIAVGGIVLDLMARRRLELDAEARVLRAQAGATWHDVLQRLDPAGLSVAVMQSNNVFSVGGSLSVNCHGWQPDHAPIAASVRSLRVVTADGALHRCSREEEAELFRLVLGAYGLCGVILDAELALVPNETYRAERFLVPVAGYAELFEREVLARSSETGLAFGRLDISPGGFLEEAVLTAFRRDPAQPPAPLEEPGTRTLKRLVFRGTVGSDYGKSLRWNAERALGGLLFSGPVTRNSLLDDDLAVLENRDPAATEVLQEYFVPPVALAGFVERLRAEVRAHDVDLLNVTVRDLRADDDSFLRYADGRMFALVLLIHQERSAAADERLQPFTRALIDSALALGGRYYLPYRLHATNAQFEAAYPMAARFFEAKRALDPAELFQNRFYQAYGR